ncbi:MAG: hypothetical protein JF626_13385 [Polaromonas sp.]|nr:hypothetical protein [Polaromonas sp.]
MATLLKIGEKSLSSEMHQLEQKELPAGAQQLMYVLSPNQAGRLSLELGHPTTVTLGKSRATLLTIKPNDLPRAFASLCGTAHGVFNWRGVIRQGREATQVRGLKSSIGTLIRSTIFLFAADRRASVIRIECSRTARFVLKAGSVMLDIRMKPGLVGVADRRPSA